MKKFFAVLFLGMSVFLQRAEATTGVVEEDGRKVGTWVENDGQDRKEKIKVKKPEESEAPALTGAAVPLESELTREEAALEMGKRQNWGIVKGMTREKVEEAAALRGFRHENEHTETIMDSFGAPRGFLVYEYRFKTEHFEHLKKVYFEPTNMLVAQILETQEPRP